MTLLDFLRTKTQARELCAIRLDGWTIFTAWIDYEDLFAIPQKYVNYSVKKHEWDSLTIVTEHGDRLNIPCHYIDI